MRLFWAVIPILLIVSMIGIAGVQESNALWFAKSPDELLKSSHTIIVGTVTAKQVLEITQTACFIHTSSEYFHHWIPVNPGCWRLVAQILYGYRTLKKSLASEFLAWITPKLVVKKPSET